MSVASKLARALVLGTVTLGSCTSMYALHSKDYDVSSLSGVRLGRSLYTAVVIIADYKYTLHSHRVKCASVSEYDAIKSQVHERSAVRLKDLCCVNGGCFIKVGQHLGSLEYLLPIEYVNTLRVLQSQAPQSPLEDIHHVIREEFGREVDEIFSSFDDTPIGAASLAQVHRATLKDTGQVVAVKVQHRRVQSNTWIDINTMHIMVGLGEWLFPEFRFRWLLEETRKNLPIELDFYNEGKNCSRVKEMFKHFTFLKVPEVHWDLTTKRVLTMEYCPGGQVNDRQYMLKHGIKMSAIVNNLTTLYNEMIFVKGYVHCDPHPGNVLVNKREDGTDEIVLLDHGLYQTLSDEFRLDYCNLWLSLLNRDTTAIHRYSEKLGTGELDHLFAGMVTSRSWKSVCAGIDKISISVEEDEIVQAEAALSIIDITNVLNRVPRQMLLIFKTNDLVRGIETSLKCRSSARSFIQTSRCCVRALYENNLSTAASLYTRLGVHVTCHWILLRLYVAALVVDVRMWASSSGTSPAPV